MYTNTVSVQLLHVEDEFHTTVDHLTREILVIIGCVLQALHS